MQIGQIKIQAIEDLQLASDDQKKKNLFYQIQIAPFPLLSFWSCFSSWVT